MSTACSVTSQSYSTLTQDTETCFTVDLISTFNIIIHHSQVHVLPEINSISGERNLYYGQHNTHYYYRIQGISQQIIYIVEPTRSIHTEAFNVMFLRHGGIGVARVRNWG